MRARIMRESSHAKKAPRRSTRYGTVFKWLVAVVVVLAVPAVFYWIFLSLFFRVQTVSVEGVEDAKADEIKDVVSSVLDKKIGGIVSGRNILLFRSKTIQDAIYYQIPEIKSATVTKQYFNALNVKVETRAPVLLWRVNGQGYYIDVSGVVVSKASDDERQLRMITVTEDGADPVAVKDQIVPAQFVEYVLQAADTLPRVAGLEVESFSTPSRLSKELHVKTDKGFTIYFDTSMDLEQRISVLRQLLNQQIPTDSISGLQYIDLRVEEWAYYK